MTKEFITNIINPKKSIVYKSPKKGQTSIRLSQQLIQSIWNRTQKLKSLPVLIVNIPANVEENYVITCHITKESK